MAATEPQTVRAQAKWVRTSARKAQVVAEHIRGRSVPEARAVLAFTPRAAARDIEKVLASAVANAEANHNLRGDDLYVLSATVDQGPTLKRWRARARGRIARIKKRTCHITVLLSPMAPEALAAEAAPRRSASPQEESPQAAEEKPKRATASKSKPTSEASKPASAQAKPERKETS
jgi:ribosomal protein L22